jgi:hypothetical protein
VASRALTGVVVGWWLILGGVTLWLMPEPTASATAEGRIARIHQVGLPRLPVPVSRTGFDAFQRGIRESDEVAMEEAFEVSEWIHVKHGQQARILRVDDDAIQIELLEGEHTGRRAWLKSTNLGPEH